MLIVSPAPFSDRLASQSRGLNLKRSPEASKDFTSLPRPASFAQSAYCAGSVTLAQKKDHAHLGGQITQRTPARRP